MLSKKNLKKRDGYVLVIVMIITMILVSVTITVTMLTTAHSNDIIKDIQRERSYHIANTALEMVYAALSKDVSGGSIIGRAGIGDFSTTKDGILVKSNFEVTNQKGDILGYADIKVDLKKMQVDDPADSTKKHDRWYYRVVATGKINKDDNPNLAKDTHILTMFIFKDDANNPKIYNGDKSL